MCILGLHLHVLLERTHEGLHVVYLEATACKNLLLISINFKSIFSDTARFV